MKSFVSGTLIALLLIVAAIFVMSDVWVATYQIGGTRAGDVHLH